MAVYTEVPFEEAATLLLRLGGMGTAETTEDQSPLSEAA